jgi:hypothetical protein
MRCERTKKKRKGRRWRPHMACGHRQSPQKAGIATTLYLVSNDLLLALNFSCREYMCRKS